jgi:hypothetical protein
LKTTWDWWWIRDGSDPCQVHLANRNSLRESVDSEDGRRDWSLVLPGKLIASLPTIIGTYADD